MKFSSDTKNVSVTPLVAKYGGEKKVLLEDTVQGKPTTP
jgi:hypothetical protein